LEDLMSVIDGVRNFFDNLFVPHDGLYRQARDLIAQHDPDGNGRVDVSAIQSGERTPPPGLFGITSRGFARADDEGNGDGQSSVREVRNLLKQYDTGNDWDPSKAGDRTIDGVELLRLLGDLSAPKPTAAPEQASRGATQAAA
jgi:hypothetical protein